MRQLIERVKGCGAADAGAVPIKALASRMTEAGRRRAEAELPGAASLICAIFPYFTDFLPGNISLYARGLDYHGALGRRLGYAARQIEAERPGVRCRVYIDASPYPEVWAAALCGLGVIGQNGLLAAPGRGSLVFIGTLATTLAGGGGGAPAFCAGCGRCVRACPGGALGPQGLDPERCLSAITQLRGALSPRQAELVARGGMAWGCDVCQKVCPMNRDMPPGGLPEFSGNLIRSLSAADLCAGRRELDARYGERAFWWRGPGPLRRNLEILGG